jgi:hypothetical protein
VKLTDAVVFPAVAVTAVGEPGTVLGTMLLDGADAVLLPATLVATTVNVYDVPLVSPVTTCEVAVLPALLSMPPAGLEVTVYPRMTLPPLNAGGEKLTVACAFPGVAETPVGGFGTVLGVTLTEGVDGAPVPIAFVATTVNV